MSKRLGIDPSQCRGIGLCAHVTDGAIRLDTWGFPMLPADGPSDVAAQAAVNVCPRRALFLAERR